MFYKKNNEEKLNPELFKEPTSEYRGTPFWAWNCELDGEELLRQIDIFREMGFGGFHMHVRTGMATPYLSDEFMALIKSCTEKAKENGMLAYLYDEDRWPSGAAGGLVTKDDRYRQRMLRFTVRPYGVNSSDAIFDQEQTTERTEEGEFITAFDVVLDSEGYIESYRTVPADGEAEGTKWYVYLDYAPKTSWFNNQSYIDTMNKEAMDKFIEVTYKAYERTVGGDFGETVPSIFTDEPQVSHKGKFQYASDKSDVTLPWTPDFHITYKAKYGEDIMEHLPELFWNLKGNYPSVTRYRYHDHVADRFSEAFGQNCGAWCDAHGLALTGHMMCEPTLYSQTLAISEAMRNYKGFGIPGIDMLSSKREYTTAKQAQSAVHQFGKEAMLSELYGVTGWDCDFREYKLQGDWQAAMGVNIRVPHLAWVSMKGEAKRDYPATISYQSPWYSEYGRVEDHFARINTALTRGKPVANVGVIHPIESYWLYWGPEEHNSAVTAEKEGNFLGITDILVKNCVDFNFISEALLPELCEKGGAPLKVGKMAYDVIIVPACETLRSSTLERLEAFKREGGKLIFMGAAPTLENAVPSERGRKLYGESTVTSFTANAIIKELDAYRSIKILYSSGAVCNRFCHQIRRDGEVSWLFIAQAVSARDKLISEFDDIDIVINGEYKVRLFNTEDGSVVSLPAEYKNGCTVVSKRMYNYDSLLLELTEGRGESAPADVSRETRTPISISNEAEYTLSEPNALLLDMAEYRLDDGEWRESEEILRLDVILARELGFPIRGRNAAQPWVRGKVKDEHTVSLRFKVNSDIEVRGARLVTERLAESKIRINGEDIAPVPEGWYVDKALETVTIPKLCKGENIIEITLPFGVSVNTEWCYIIGDFGVDVRGRSTRIIPLPEKLAFGDITHQGFPFYGGNITYKVRVKSESGRLSVMTPQYVGALVTLNSDKGIIYPPYTAEIETERGESTLDITLFGNRQNSFGHVHNADRNYYWLGPPSWRTEGTFWSYEYVLRPLGILTTPIIEEIK